MVPRQRARSTSVSTHRHEAVHAWSSPLPRSGAPSPGHPAQVGAMPTGRGGTFGVAVESGGASSPRPGSARRQIIAPSRMARRSMGIETSSREARADRTTAEGHRADGPRGLGFECGGGSRSAQVGATGERGAPFPKGQGTPHRRSTQTGQANRPTRGGRGRCSPDGCADACPLPAPGGHPRARARWCRLPRGRCSHRSARGSVAERHPLPRARAP